MNLQSLSTHSPQVSRRGYMKFFLSTAVSASAMGILYGCSRSVIGLGEKIDLKNSDAIISRERDKRLSIVLTVLHTQGEPHLMRGGYMIYKLPNAMLIQSIAPDEDVTLEYGESGLLTNLSQKPIALGSDIGLILSKIESSPL